jgi:bifunctional non-homologous end joining protein LigD
MVSATDQLSLRLETDRPTLPNPPTGLRPMLPRPLAEPFDSADHLFEPSWGGVRALVTVGPAEVAGAGAVRIAVAEDRDVTEALPELAGLAVRIEARSAILDGELVVVDPAGRADTEALEARLDGRGGRPVAYLAFDLLHLDGRSLLGLPLTKRRQLLRRVLRPGDEVVAVPAIAGEGRALYDAALGQGIAGIMARQRQSPYLPGVRSRLWRFVAVQPDKVRGTAEATDSDADAPLASTGRVLALISRLPLGLDEE